MVCHSSGLPPVSPVSPVTASPCTQLWGAALARICPARAQQYVPVRAENGIAAPHKHLTSSNMGHPVLCTAAVRHRAVFSFGQFDLPLSTHALFNYSVGEKEVFWRIGPSALVPAASRALTIPLSPRVQVSHRDSPAPHSLRPLPSLLPSDPTSNACASRGAGEACDCKRQPHLFTHGAKAG